MPRVSADSPPDPLERHRRYVVPVPPDEERLATDVIVGHESPISAVLAVVAIVAHHEVTALRDLARESRLIVYAVLATGKRPDATDPHRRRIRQVRDVVGHIAEP